MKLSSKLFLYASLMLLLSACCRWKHEPISRDKRTEQVTKSLDAVKALSPFYWQEAKKVPIEVKLGDKQLVLCTVASSVSEDKIPADWTKLDTEYQALLYRPKSYESQSVRYYRALVAKEQVLPAFARELYRGEQYYDSLNKEVVWESDELRVKLAGFTEFKALCELADLLDLVIVRRDDLFGWYTLSARYSRYRAWQLAHILYEDEATSTAKPLFIAIQP